MEYIFAQAVPLPRTAPLGSKGSSFGGLCSLTI
jgi:hypothetical protein